MDLEGVQLITARGPCCGSRAADAASSWVFQLPRVLPTSLPGRVPRCSCPDPFLHPENRVHGSHTQEALGDRVTCVTLRVTGQSRASWPQAGRCPVGFALLPPGALAGSMPTGRHTRAEASLGPLSFPAGPGRTGTRGRDRPALSVPFALARRPSSVERRLLPAVISLVRLMGAIVSNYPAEGPIMRLTCAGSELTMSRALICIALR